MSRNSVAHASSPSSSSTPSASSADDQLRQQVVLAVGVDEQRLGRVADAGALHLGVDRDRDRPGRVGGRVDVDVAVAAGGRQHRDPRALEQQLLQRLAAAGDDDVGRLGVGDEPLQLLARLGQRLDGVSRQPGGGQALAHHVEQDGVGVDGQAGAAQHADVARLDAQGGGVDGDVRPGLVDDQDDAQRDAQLVRRHAVGQLEPADGGAHRIGEGDHVADGGGQPGNAVGRQRQAVDDRRPSRPPPRRRRGRWRRGSRRRGPRSPRRSAPGRRPWRRCRSAASSRAARRAAVVTVSTAGMLTTAQGYLGAPPHRSPCARPGRAARPPDRR